MNGAAPLLEVRGLCRSFRLRRRGPTGELAAVDDVSFSIQRGEILGLAGESGSGKSTLARLLVQLIAPSAGTILLDGRPLSGMGANEKRATRRRIQIIFQDPSATLSPRRTIGQSLAEPLAHFGIGSRAERAHIAIEALDAVGLDAAALHRLPHQFSSGQRQRIGIARALVVNPDLVVADEAVSALDVSVQAQIIRLLLRLREQRDLAFLFISHDLAVIRQLADAVAVMLDGRLVETGTAAELFTRPAHPYTRQLLAAVPNPDPATAPPDTLPAPGLHRNQRAGGCAFATRCPDAMAHCAARKPETCMAGGGDTHRVQCHLYPADTGNASQAHR